MKELKLKVGSETVAIGLGSKIAKEDLYGEVRRVVEKDGCRLERGYLSPDGKLLKRSQIANLGVDPEGTPLEPPAVYLDDRAVEAVPSSFDKETELCAAPLTRLVELNVTDVYDVDAETLKPGLYEGCFNYRKSYLTRDALLLVRKDDAFLLVGQFKKTTFVGKNSTYEFFDAGEEQEEVDPLDFSMM